MRDYCSGVLNPKIGDLLSDRCPGLRWETWEPKYLPTLEEVKRDRLADEIVAFLGGLNEGIDKVSVAQLKKLMRNEHVHKNVWSKAGVEAANSADGWIKRGRSFVRAEATDYGF